jgi:hypothetical protein
MIRLLALVLMPTLCCLAAEAKRLPGEGSETFPKPADGKHWKHPESGVQLPQRLGGLTMRAGSRYETPELGVSMRYENEDGRVRADVYVYPCPLPHGTEEEKLKTVSGEAGNALGEVKEMERRGHYKKVEYSEGESWRIPIGPKEKTVFVEVPLSYLIHEDAGTGEAATQVRSRLGVAVVGDYFVKVRYTYPADRKEEGEAESVEWVKKVRVALSEPYLRPAVEEALKVYHQDPLSAEGEAAAGSVVTYAEESPFVWLTVPSEVVQWGELCNKVAPDSHLHLLRAYIVGGVEASLRDQTGDAVTEAAMARTADIYRRIKKQHAGLKVNELEELAEAADAKKGAEFFKNLDSIAKKAK